MGNVLLEQYGTGWKDDHLKMWELWEACGETRYFFEFFLTTNR